MLNTRTRLLGSSFWLWQVPLVLPSPEWSCHLFATYWKLVSLCLTNWFSTSWMVLKWGHCPPNGLVTNSLSSNSFVSGFLLLQFSTRTGTSWKVMPFFRMILFVPHMVKRSSSWSLPPEWSLMSPLDWRRWVVTSRLWPPAVDWSPD